MPYANPQSDAAKHSHRKATARYQATHPKYQAMASKRWRQNNPEKAKKSNGYSRKRHLSSCYNGFTDNLYNVMLHQQKGQCAICPRTPDQERYGKFHIDHDHSTGNVRGLLCAKHNLALGLFADST